MSTDSPQQPHEFDLFVKGLDDKTFTIPKVQSNAKISDIMDKIEQRTGLKPDEQRLIFGAKPLLPENTLKDYGITRGSTIFLVLRLHGGDDEKRHNPDDPDVELTNEPDMITFDDDPTNPRAKMPCGHGITPESLTAYIRSLVTEGKFQFFCPYVDKNDSNIRCRVEWDYLDIRALALLTDDECSFFETKIAENYALRAIGIQQCPRCESYCERVNKTITNVICLACTGKPGACQFAFCWYCCHEVSAAHAYACKNADCGGIEPRLAILAKAPLKAVHSIKNVPSRRACPNCGIIIEHDRACKHMKCRCETEFCFVCLKRKIGGDWQCGGPFSVCEIAPVQTTIPGQ